MSEPRGYIRPRAGKLQAVICLADGSKVRKATGLSVGQEEQAQRFLDDVLAELRSAAPAASRGGLTFKEWGERWISERKARKVVSVCNEEAQLTYHAFPQLGALPLSSLTRSLMLEWVKALPSRLTENTRELLSSRYVHHVAGTVKRCLEEAVDAEQIAENPCRWKARRDLPAKRDKQAGKRNRAGFDGWEVWELLHDERIPEDRRVMYGLDFLSGMRPGEVAARRWRDLDTTAAPLWRLDVWTAINSRDGSEKSTKTNVEKVVPIHPVLAGLLRTWHAEGWQRFMGRAPTPDDLIVPREEGAARTNTHSNKRFKGDLARLGLREGRSHYETRSSFRSLALAGGATRSDLDLVTHPSPREASDLYTRLAVVWPALCRAVECVQIAPRDPVSAPSGEVTEGVTLSAPEKEKARRLSGFGPSGNMGAAGFEPATPAV